MLGIRNLKILNERVETPIHKDTKLIRWEHEDEDGESHIVWSDGDLDGFILVKAAGANPPYVIDYTENKVYRIPYNYWGNQDPIFTTKNHVYMCRIGYSRAVSRVDNITAEGLVLTDYTDDRFGAAIYGVLPCENGFFIRTNEFQMEVGDQYVTVPHFFYFDDETEEFIEVTNNNDEIDTPAWDITINFAMYSLQYGGVINGSKMDIRTSPAPNKVLLNSVAGWAIEDLYELSVSKYNGEYSFSLRYLQRLQTQTNYVSAAYGYFTRVEDIDGEKIRYDSGGFVVATSLRNEIGSYLSFWVNGESIGSKGVDNAGLYPNIKYYGGYFYIWHNGSYYRTDDFDFFENISKAVKIEPFQFSDRYKGVILSSSGSVTEEGYATARFQGLNGGNYLAYIPKGNGMKPMMNLPFFSYSYGSQYIYSVDLKEDNKNNLATNGIAAGDIIRV